MNSDDAIALQAERHILLIRSQKVMLDADLAQLYGVETRVLNQAVKRNIDRFPEDFMFQLTEHEAEVLNRTRPLSLKPGSDLNSSQIVMSSRKHRGKAYLPYAFTEHGVAMLSSVLRSDRAVQVNIAIMRAFVRLRQMLSSNEDLARKLIEMEKKYDADFKIVFDALRQLMGPPPAKPRSEIGFHTVSDTKPGKIKTTMRHTSRPPGSLTGK